MSETTTRRSRKPAQEYVPADDAERIAQSAAAKAMALRDEIEDAQPEISDEDLPDEIALQNVLSELGSSATEAKVNVYQLDSRNKRAFVGSFSPVEFSLERVQAEYGSGDYEVRVHNGRMISRKVIRIAAQKNPTTVPMSAQPDMTKIIETMNSGFEKMSGMFANALANLSVNQPKPKTTMEMLQEMQLMKEVMGMNRPVQQTDPLQVIELAKSLAETITPRVGEPGTGEVILEAIKNFGPMLMQGMQQNATQQIAHPQITSPQLTAPLQSNPIEPKPAIPGETDQMNILKKYYLNLLIENAKADNDPETYANVALDLLGEEKVLELVNAPDWFEMLCKEEPRAIEHRLWFDELRNHVIDLTKPELVDIQDEVKPPQAIPNDVLQQ